MDQIDRTMLESALSELEAMSTDLRTNSSASYEAIRAAENAMAEVEKCLKRKD